MQNEDCRMQITGEQNLISFLSLKIVFKSYFFAFEPI